MTLARALTDTFSGIRPADIPGFITAETAGAVAAVIMFRWLLPDNCVDVDLAARKPIQQG